MGGPAEEFIGDRIGGETFEVASGPVQPGWVLLQEDLYEVSADATCRQVLAGRDGLSACTGQVSPCGTGVALRQV